MNSPRKCKLKAGGTVDNDIFDPIFIKSEKLTFFFIAFYLLAQSYAHRVKGSNVAATNIIIIVPYISFYPQMKEDTENMPLFVDKDKYVTV